VIQSHDNPTSTRTADVAAAAENRRDVLVILLGDVGRVYAQLRGSKAGWRLPTRTSKRTKILLSHHGQSEAGPATELDVSRAAQLESHMAGGTVPRVWRLGVGRTLDATSGPLGPSKETPRVHGRRAAFLPRAIFTSARM
jgi:hypothetical protein